MRKRARSAAVLQVYAKTMIEIQAAILEHRKEKTPPVQARGPRIANKRDKGRTVRL